MVLAFLIGSGNRQTFGKNPKTIACSSSYISEPALSIKNTYCFLSLLGPAYVAFDNEDERVEPSISLLAAFNPIRHFPFVPFCVVS